MPHGIDALTGLPGLDALGFDWPGLHRMPATTGACVAVFDIDAFIYVNDQLGWPTADHALQAIAAVMRQQIGDRARAYRVAGDEFLLLSTQLPYEDFVALARDIQLAVHDLGLPYRGHPSQARDRVTVSVAVTRAAQEARWQQVWAALIDRIDEEKQSGRCAVGFQTFCMV